MGKGTEDMKGMVVFFCTSSVVSYIYALSGQKKKIKNKRCCKVAMLIHSPADDAQGSPSHFHSGYHQASGIFAKQTGKKWILF